MLLLCHPTIPILSLKHCLVNLLSCERSVRVVIWPSPWFPRSYSHTFIKALSCEFAQLREISESHNLALPLISKKQFPFPPPPYPFLSTFCYPFPHACTLRYPFLHTLCYMNLVMSSRHLKILWTIIIWLNNFIPSLAPW